MQQDRDQPRPKSTPRTAMVEVFWPVRVLESIGFLERATGIEPKPEAWDDSQSHTRLAGHSRGISATNIAIKAWKRLVNLHYRRRQSCDRDSYDSGQVLRHLDHGQATELSSALRNMPATVFGQARNAFLSAVRPLSRPFQKARLSADFTPRTACSA